MIDGINLAITAFVVISWVWGNNESIRWVIRYPGLILCFIGFGVINAVYLPFSIYNHDWLDAIMEAVITAMCARIVWHWWRRRRQGKPSRALGIVRDIGHRLAVIAIRPEVG